MILRCIRFGSFFFHPQEISSDWRDGERGISRSERWEIEAGTLRVIGWIHLLEFIVLRDGDDEGRWGEHKSGEGQGCQVRGGGRLSFA